MIKKLAVILAMVMCLSIVLTSCGKATVSINFGDDFEKDTLSLKKLPWFSTIDDTKDFLDMDNTPKLSADKDTDMSYFTVPFEYEDLSQEGQIEFGLVPMGEERGFDKEESRLQTITYSFEFDSKQELTKFTKNFEAHLKNISDKNHSFKEFFGEDGILYENPVFIKYENDIVKDWELDYYEYSVFYGCDLTNESDSPIVDEMREKYDSDYVFEWVFTVLGR